MATVKSVCEQALGLLGISETVTDISTDGTARSKALLRYYDSVVEWAFTQNPWNFATRYFELTGQTGTGTAAVTGTDTVTFSVTQDGTLDVGDTVTIGSTEYEITARTSGTVWTTSGANVSASAFTITKEVTSDPTPDWAYAYRVPSKALFVRRLVDGNRMPIRSNKPVFRTGSDGDGKLLYTDHNTDVIIEFTESVDEADWPTDFAMGVAGVLAFHVAPLLAEGATGVMDRAYAIGTQWLAKAAATDAMENTPDDEPASDLEQFRNGGDDLAYWYPRLRAQ